jgi:hypothetical protein
MEAYVEIIREDGSLERHRIEGDQITVGRSPKAGVPVPDGRDLEDEHLLIAPRGEGCWVAIAQGARLAGRVRGEPFQHGMLAWGTELELGNFKFRVTDRLPKEKKDGEQQSSPIVLFGGVGMILVLLWVAMDEGGAEIDTAAPSDPLVLFDTEYPCPQTGAGALHRADANSEAALAKSERYPFDATDGVESVRLYREAQSCYATSGVGDAAGEMQREADFMQRRIEEDYRTHRLRLERTLEMGRNEDALLEVRALELLTSHRAGHPYVQWLDMMDRQLQVVIATPAAE